MIVTLLLWFYQFFIILPFGIYIRGLFNKNFQKASSDFPFVVVAFLVGITFLTTLSSFFSIFINIGWQVHLFVLISSISLWGYLYRSKNIPAFQVKLAHLNKVQWISLALLFVSMCIILFSATTAPENPDTGIYHAQAIRWIETYKAVPGLGNLHARFAYNSSWLVINALFSLSFLKIQSFHALPSLLFLTSAVYFYGGVFAVSGGSRKISDFVKYGFFVASFLLLRNEISSPGTDLPVTLILWIICSEWVKLLEGFNDSSNRDGLWLAIVGFYCMTIKLSSAPIVLFIFWVLIIEFRKKRYKSIIVLCCAALLVFAPFIGRNIILSGHLVYPGLKADPIHVDWGIPAEWVEIEKYTIHRFAMLPRVEKDVFATMAVQLQYKKWFYDQIPRHKAMLAFLVLIPLPVILLLPFKKWRNLLSAQRLILWPIITMYIGVVFWLITAPTFRFGYGFILATIMILSALFGQFLISVSDKVKIGLPVLAILLSFFILVNAGRGSIHSESFIKRALMPLDYPIWKTEKCDFGNFSIQCAVEWASCWYSEFPCAIKGVPNVEMRGFDYGEGFRGIP